MTADSFLKFVAGVQESPALFDFFKSVLDAADELVIAAQREEKERCAKLADEERKICSRAAECECDDPETSDWSLRAATAKVIAEKIRSGE